MGYRLLFGWSIAGLLALALFCPTGTTRAARPRTVQPQSVLFVLAAHATFVNQYVDPRVKAELNHAGWQVGRCDLPNLTWNLLRKFNVVVLCRMPPANQPSGADLGVKAPLLYRFIRAGGGLLLLHDESYDEVFITENRFLKPLGAKIVNQEVLDPKHRWQQRNFLQYWFAWTNNIARHNPVTKGVHTLWYPELQNNGEGRLTCPVVTNSAWTVLARGMASAYSYRLVAGPKGGAHEMFHTAPPILASRSYGAGRVVIFPSHSTFTLQSGYFITWQGVVMSRGAEKRPSNTGRMLFNALAWLAKPSQTSGKLGGYVQPSPINTVAGSKRHALWLASDFLSPPPAYEKQHTFKGLIGAHSALSDGQGTVAQWAAAAQAAGYDFLVFTEAFPPMTKARWGLLTRECQKASNARFLCIPGIAYRDGNNDHWVTFAFPKWPQADWLTKGGHRIANMPGLYFGNNWAPNAIVNTMHNPVGPRLRKFFGAIAVDSYRFEKGRCQRFDNARGTYLRLMGDQYNSCPIAYYDMHRPADIQAIAKAHGYVDYAWRGKLADVAHAFKMHWYAQPQQTYISQGPRLKSWWIQGSQKVPPSYRRRPWRLHIDVRSKTPLSRVTIYDGNSLFRRFAASGHSFRRVITGLHDQQDYFVLTARDAKGRRLISPTLRTSNLRQNIFMCTDMQNTIDAGVTRSRHGRWATIFMVGNTDTGWNGQMLPLVLEPQRDLMPQGLDFQENDWTGWDSPALYTTQGSESPIARLNLAFGSGDCTILDQEFNTTLLPGSIPVSTRLAVGYAEQIEFTPRIYSVNLMLVRQRTILKRTVQLSAQPELDLQVIGLSGPNLSFPKFAYIQANGSLVKGRRPLTGTMVAKDAPIQIGGYAALYPDFYGSGAIFPLRSQMRLLGHRWHKEPLRLRMRGAAITLGYRMAGRTLPAGTRFRQTFLVMRGKFGDDHGRCFQQVRQLYGLDGPPAYHVKTSWGAVKDTRFTLDLAAKDGAAVASVSRAPLPDDLPVRIHGLRGRWSAVCADLPLNGGAINDPGSLKWRPMGIYHGVGYLAINITKHARRLFIGHPLVCNQPALFLNLINWNKTGLTVDVHNPTAKPIHTVLRIASVLGRGSRLLAVPAESSVMAAVPWSPAHAEGRAASVPPRKNGVLRSAKKVKKPAGSAYASPRQQSLLNKAFVLRGTTLGGKPFSSASWKGKVVFVDFWATWCGPCRTAIPHDVALYKKYHRKGLEIVGVSNDNSVTALRQFLKGNPKIVWPQLFGPHQHGWSPLSAQYGIYGIPTQFFIDRRGVLRYVVVGLDPALVARDAAALIHHKRAAPGHKRPEPTPKRLP